MGRPGSRALLRSLLKRYRRQVLGLSFLAVTQSALQVALAFLIRNVIDAAIEGREQLWLWAALLVGNILLQVGLYALYNWCAGAAYDRFSAQLRGRLLESAVYSSGVRLQAMHSGALLSRGIEDVNTVCDGMIHALPTLLGQLARLVGSFLAVLVIWPGLSGVLLAGGLLAAGGIAVLRPILKKKHRKVRQAEEQVAAAMQEDMQKLELIQSLQCQQQTCLRFDRLLKQSLRAKWQRRILRVGGNSIISTASLLGTAVLLLWGAVQLGNGLSYGALTSLIQLVGQFRGPVLSISGLWTRFAAVEVAGERLRELLDMPPASAPAQDPEPAAIVFENVTFRYPNDDTAVVEHFDLRLELNGWSTLGGVSGRGKTTLFKLILGLYTPQEGRVYLDTPQGQLPCSEQTRHLFAYVPQDYGLFTGTVLENLQLVRPQADSQCYRQALELAGAEFLWEQGQGLDTPVGENNTGLSKGQLQRIAIARALLMERKILLLDECTSALDAETERRVLKNLYGCCKKAILVTHRPEALADIAQLKQTSLDS